MINFQCECGKEIKVPEEYAGKRAKCKGCGEIIRVPEAAMVVDDSGMYGLMEEVLDSKPEPAKPVARTGPTCGHCGSEVREGAKLCLNCGGLIDGKKLKTKVRKDGVKEQAARAAGSLVLAMIAGGVVAVVCGAIWAGIAIVTNYEIGYVAWGIGLLVGLAVATIAGTQNFAVGTYAAGLAALGLIIGKLMIFQWGVAGQALEELGGNPEVQLAGVTIMMVEERQFGDSVQSYLDDNGCTTIEKLGEIELPDKISEQFTVEITHRYDSLNDVELKTAVKDYYFPAVMDQISYSDRISSSFSPWDFLWFGLALFTAFRVGAGGTE